MEHRPSSILQSLKDTTWLEREPQTQDREGGTLSS
jgi:hypothetical protein